MVWHAMPKSFSAELWCCIWLSMWTIIAVWPSSVVVCCAVCCCCCCCSCGIGCCCPWGDEVDAGTGDVDLLLWVSSAGGSFAVILRMFSSSLRAISCYPSLLAAAARLCATCAFDLEFMMAPLVLASADKINFTTLGSKSDTSDTLFWAHPIMVARCDAGSFLCSSPMNVILVLIGQCDERQGQVCEHDCVHVFIIVDIGLDHHVILLSLIEVGNKVLDGCIVVHVYCDGLVHVIRALDFIPSFETCGG